MEDINIYEQAIENVELIEMDGTITLFIFNLYEINNKNIKFFLNDDEGGEEVFQGTKNILYLHTQSDQTVKIPIKKDELYEKLKKVDSISIYEIDWTNGDLTNFYLASK